MATKFVHDLLFGVAFGIGFSLASWVAGLLIAVLSHAR
jgi:hypothetical protein